MTLPAPLSGRFHFVRNLRATKGSVIWLARDAETNKIVVVSTVPQARVPGLQASMGVEHEHLAPIIEVIPTVPASEVPGELPHGKTTAALAVAEHVDGMTLHDRLEKKPIPTVKAVQWMLAVGQAVAAIHERGGVHGAISARAIIVSRSDGGVAPVLTNLRVPTNGAYCSPARVLGKGPSQEDDVWALYATLFTSLARKTPFSGKSRSELARNIVHAKHNRLPDSLKQPELASLLEAGFVVSARNRARTIEQFVTRLSDWLKRQGHEMQIQASSLAPPAVSDHETNEPRVPSASSSAPLAQTSMFDDEEDVKTVRMDTQLAHQALEAVEARRNAQQRDRASVDDLAATRLDGWKAARPQDISSDDDEFDDEDDDDQMKTAVFASSVARELLQDFDEEDDEEDDDEETHVMHVDDLPPILGDQIRVLSGNKPPPGLSSSSPVFAQSFSPSTSTSVSDESFDAAAALLSGKSSPSEQQPQAPAPAPAEVSQPQVAPTQQPTRQLRQETSESSALQLPNADVASAPAAAPPLPPRIPQAAIATQQLAPIKPKRKIRWLVWLLLFLVGGLISFFVTVRVLGLENRVRTLWYRWTKHTPPISASTAASSTPSAPPASSSGTAPMVASSPNVAAASDASTTPVGDASATPDAGDSPTRQVDTNACVESFLPGRTFAHKPDLGYVCSETDLRKIADRLQADIVKGGAGKVSASMKAWSSLGWFELPLCSTIRQKCCANPPPVHLPDLGNDCASLQKEVGKLTNGICSANDVTKRAERFRDAVTCLFAHNIPRPYRYGRRPSLPQRAMFENLISKGCKSVGSAEQP